jgi:hypothetical protein
VVDPELLDNLFVDWGGVRYMSDTNSMSSTPFEYGAPSHESYLQVRLSPLL